MDFPHLKDSTPFPTADTHVYKYRNEFDYERYQRNVRIKVCRVPWCGDYENVVKFADEAARDAYLDSLEGVEFETMFNVVPSTSVKVPVPTTSMQLYNYLVVDLPMATSEADPIAYADSPRISRYAYFIDGVSQRASSTCECAVRMDVWTTYIEHVEFRYAMLERGHAPMAATDLDAYLADPASNNRYLLAPDANLGDDAAVYVRDETVVNFESGDMWFCIATDAWPVVEWGSIDGLTARTPTADISYSQGHPAPSVWAIETDGDEVHEFFDAIRQQCPQFMATIRATFLIQKSLVRVNDEWGTIVFCGHTLTRLTAGQSVRTLFDLADAEFGFPDEYARIAKLYTYPYSCIRVYSEDGTQQVVRIENMEGPLMLRSCMSLIWPYIAVDTHLLNVGGVSGDMTFNAINDGWTFTYGGSFASYFKRHDVPCFYVVQSGEDRATWEHLYDREQARIAAENDYASSAAMAGATYDNMAAAANTSYNNSVNSASNITSIAALTVAANNNSLDESQTLLNQTTFASDDKIAGDRRADQDLADANYAADLDSNAVAADNNTVTTEANVFSHQVSATLGGAATGAMIGSAIPAFGTAAGAAVGAVLGAATSTYVSTYATDVATTMASSAATNASLEIALTNLESIYTAASDAAADKSSNAVSYLYDYRDAKSDYLDNTTAIQNDLTTGTANQNANLIRTNAANTRSTELANAQRTYDAAMTMAANNRSTALSAIENGRKQQGLDAPYRCGQSSDGETASTRPLGLWAQVVTESDAAIKYAGDSFLRYGYALDAEWDIGELQVMRHFTYWRCSDVWCAGSKAVVEAAQQTLKDIMKAGVTVWSDPDEIGQVSIYDNFDG